MSKIYEEPPKAPIPPTTRALKGSTKGSPYKPAYFFGVVCGVILTLILLEIIT